VAILCAVNLTPYLDVENGSTITVWYFLYDRDQITDRDVATVRAKLNGISFIERAHLFSYSLFSYYLFSRDAYQSRIVKQLFLQFYDYEQDQYQQQRKTRENQKRE